MHLSQGLLSVPFVMQAMADARLLNNHAERRGARRRAWAETSDVVAAA